MKWLLAKHINALIAVLSLLVIAAGYSTWKTFSPQEPQVTFNAKGSFEIGFYDLMSGDKEIYDSEMRVANTTLFSTITSPEDNRFIFKGKFAQTLARHGKHYYTLSPIYYSTPQRGLMIDGLMDLLMQTRFWIMPLQTNVESLVVAQTGAIIIYPPRLTTDLNPADSLPPPDED